MPPARIDVGIETTRLNRVVEYEPADLTVTVEAGMRFAELQRTLGEQGQFLALDPPVEEGATIGGVIATNASGPLRFAFGTARDLVIGTRVANPGGTVTHAGGRVVKNVAGYDLNKLYIGSLGTLAVIWYGGLQAIGGQLTIGELIAFNTYLGFLLFPILTIGFQAAGISRAGASALRVFEIVDAPLDVQEQPGAPPLPPIDCCVEMRNVHFRYPGSELEVLRGVSFRAEPGQTVAILGTTGSGKSSLVNLLPRFYDVTDGSVALDDHDVRTVTLASLRSQIGIVLQETLLFSGSVRDNIAYGKPDAAQEDVEAAARAAQADEFIRALPQGYETVVGERGVGLSGGQRQRIAIARALLIDPHLLILDDSTSAVDAGTEAALLETLDRLMRDRRRTALVIAQRLSTVRDADLILVLDEGRIAATGTHEQLSRESALYNEILGTQLAADEVAA